MRFLPGRKGLWSRFKSDETGSICVGCGLDVNNITGLLEVQLSGGDPGSGLHCDNTTGLSLAVQHPGSLSGNGTTISPLVPVASPDDCNSLVVRGNGLYTPCSDSNVNSSAVQTSPQGVGLPQLVADGGNYGYLNDNAVNSVHICNPTCCNAGGIVFIAVSDVYLQAAQGLSGGAHLEINVDNTGFNTMSPIPTVKFDNNGTGDTVYAVNLNATYYLGFSPGQCHDIQLNLEFNIGPAGINSHIRTDSTGPKFVTRWVVSPTGCCDHIG